MRLPRFIERLFWRPLKPVKEFDLDWYLPLRLRRYWYRIVGFFKRDSFAGTTLNMTDGELLLVKKVVNSNTLEVHRPW